MLSPAADQLAAVVARPRRPDAAPAGGVCRGLHTGRGASGAMPSCRSPPTCTRSACSARSTMSARWRVLAMPRAGHAAIGVHRRPGLRPLRRRRTRRTCRTAKRSRPRSSTVSWRPGLAQDAADLALRRARRLLRPRAAAGCRAARRRPGADQLVRALLGGCPAQTPRSARQIAAGQRRAAGYTSTGSGSRRSSCRRMPGPATYSNATMTTPRCSSSSSTSGTCRR